MKTKAVILVALNKPLEIEEIEIPTLKPGQVLVRLLFSGLCGSQLGEIAGKRGKDRYLPHLLGHEGSGIVKETGPQVAKVCKGDYVVCSWIKGKGLDVSSTTYALGKTRIQAGAITTLSQYSVVSENRVFKIPKSIPPPVAALLGCAVPTGAGIIKNELKLNGKNSLAIFGVGGIGSSALLYAKALGCSPIIAVDIHDSKLRFAKKLGATFTLNAARQEVFSSVMKWTSGKGIDFAMEASGSKQAMEQAFAAIHSQGTVILAGNLPFQEKIEINPFELIQGKKIFGTWGGKTKPDLDIPFYAGQYLKKQLPLRQLITQIYPLDEIASAFNDLKRGKVIRALVDCR